MGVATGTFVLPNGSPVANGAYQWKLSSDAILSGTSCNAPRLFGGHLDTNGNLTATFNFNDVLLTSSGTSTTYQLTVKDVGGGQVWNETYYLTGTAANINLVAPGSGPSGPVLFPIPLPAIPDSIQTVSATALIGFPTTANTMIEAIAGAGGITLTIASAIGVPGRRMTIIQTDAGVGGVLLTGTAGQTFSGQPSLQLTNQWQTYTLEADNANWFIVGSFG
jgi:hypothetical protein